MSQWFTASARGHTDIRLKQSLETGHLYNFTFLLILLGRRKMLQCHLDCVHLGNLLRDVVPLVLHCSLQNILVHLSVLERQLQLLVRLLRARLQVVHLLNQNGNAGRHLFVSGGCF